MMFWYGNGMNGWGYALMVVGMIVFWVLIVVAVIAVIRALTPATTPTPQPPAPASDTPEHLLAQRLARGEIDEDAYKRTLHLLKQRYQSRPEGR